MKDSGWESMPARAMPIVASAINLGATGPFTIPPDTIPLLGHTVLITMHFRRTTCEDTIEVSTVDNAPLVPNIAWICKVD